MTPEALEAAVGDSLLEKLQAALVSLGKHRYEFGDWSQCTCGHIYRAAHGRGTSKEHKVLDDESANFRALLEVVIEANAIEVYATNVGDLRRAVSDATFERVPRRLVNHGPEFERAARKAAIELIEKAVVFERERNEKARLALIGS